MMCSGWMPSSAGVELRFWEVAWHVRGMVQEDDSNVGGAVVLLDASEEEVHRR
jgi:hypothetical protein